MQSTAQLEFSDDKWELQYVLAAKWKLSAANWEFSDNKWDLAWMLNGSYYIWLIDLSAAIFNFRHYSISGSTLTVYSLHMKHL